MKKGGVIPDSGFVRWFSELNKDSIAVAGGKGANLGEMYNFKIPVPPGFVVTAQAYDFFIEKAGLKNKIKEMLDEINYEDTKQLDEITKKVRRLIVDSDFPGEMRKEIVGAYEDLAGDKDAPVYELLKRIPEHIFVAVRSSATAEDLEDASFAGQQDSFLNIKGTENLIEAIKKCFASLFTSRATYYRHKKGFKHEETSLAVVIQKMVDSDKSGVIFSKDPSYNNDNVIIEAVFGLGVGIVSGMITPDKYIVSREFEIVDRKISDKKIALTRNAGGEEKEVGLTNEKSLSAVLNNIEIKKLSELALRLEEHYHKPQDIEFAIEGKDIFIVQTRAITTMEKRFELKDVEQIKGEAILSGLAASPGVASGKVKIVHTLDDLQKIQAGDVLVTKMTNPDMVVTMQKSSAIVTDEGGLTAHAAIVSREMGIPCVVGTKEATGKLKDGEIVTVDGFNGKVYAGKVGETKKKEIHEVVANTKTKLKVMVDLPSFAERASKTGLKSVGLLRMEGIIAESGKHPNYFLQNQKFEDYEKADCILLIGTDPKLTYPVAFDKILKSKAKLICVEDLKNETSKEADLFLEILDGTELALLNSLLYLLIKNNKIKREIPEDLKDVIKHYTPEYASKICRIDKKKIIKAYKLIVKSKNFILGYGMGLTQHVYGTNNVFSAINLVLGKNGKIIPMRGKVNIQGVNDMGCVPKCGGRTLVEYFSEKPVKCLYIKERNPAQSVPNLNEVHKEMKKMFIIMHLQSPNKTMEFANVVLPSCSWAEHSGTFTNAESRIRYFDKLINPLYESKENWKIIVELAKYFGKNYNYKKIEDIWQDIKEIEGYENINEVKNNINGKFVNYKVKFERFNTVEFLSLEEKTSKEYPYVLTTERWRYQFCTSTMSSKSKTLNNLEKEPLCFVSTEDAEYLELKDNDNLRIYSKSGEIIIKIKISHDIPKNLLVVPFHFEKCLVNKLFPFEIDPLSKTANLKRVAVNIEKWD